MMICDADFDELFPARDRREAAIMHPVWPTRLLVLMPAAAALITASQVLQSMARSTGGGRIRRAPGVDDRGPANFGAADAGSIQALEPTTPETR